MRTLPSSLGLLLVRARRQPRHHLLPVRHVLHRDVTCDGEFDGLVHAEPDGGVGHLAQDGGAVAAVEALRALRRGDRAAAATNDRAARRRGPGTGASKPLYFLGWPHRSRSTAAAPTSGANGVGQPNPNESPELATV